MSKTYAVTGVASGIGAELARILRGRGHRVIGFDIVETERTVDRFLPLDLDDPDSIARAAAAVDEPLDGLCNNAGLPPRDGLAAKILQVNFLGQRAFTRALLPRLGAGAGIVNTASRAGHGWREGLEQVRRLSGVADRAALDRFVADEAIDPARAYALSKEAMILWTMAETEPMIARGLRINSISPGAIATGLLDDFARVFGAPMARNVERAGRPGTAAEAAEVAAFLLSPEAGWLKGCDITIDGGMAAFNASDALALAPLQMTGG